MRNLLICIMLIGCCFSAHSQFIVKGKVIDRASGEPLENAVIKDIQRGKTTISDQSGNFELHISEPTDSLRVSYVGYRLQSLAIGKPGVPCLIRLERGQVDLKSITI